MPLIKRDLLLIGMILLFCAAAAALFLYTTPHGVGLTNDSSAYLGGARSLLNGQGYVRFSGDRLPRPITHFPPLLSLFIAGIARIGSVDVFTAAKTLNLICFVLNLLLLIFFIMRSGGMRVMVFFSGLLYLACAPVLQAHAYGLSEGLFLVFLFTSWHLTLTQSSRPRAAPIAFLNGICIGLATLTRYAGVALLIVTLGFLFFHRKTLRSCLIGVAFLLTGFALSVAPWILRNARVSGAVANRGIFFHPPSASVINEGIETLTGFFLPETGGWIVKILPWLKFGWTLVFLAFAVWLAKRLVRRLTSNSLPEQNTAASTLSGLFALGYLIFLIGIALFIDGSTVFDNRMLLPFFAAIIVMILSLAAEELSKKHLMMQKRGLILLTLTIFALFLAEDQLDLAREFHKDGQGFAGSSWSEMEISQAVDDLPADATYFSNRQTYLWLMKDLPSYILPQLSDAATRQENETFESDRQWMKQEILDGNAYAVVFNYQEMMENPSDRAWLTLLFEGVPVYLETKDGIIYGE